MDENAQDPTSVGQDMPNQQERVRELIKTYEALPHGAGLAAATLMERSLQEADKAVASGDVVAIVRAYQDLAGYEE